MKKIHCLNPISAHGLELLDTNKYCLTDDFEQAEGALVRSASMHELTIPSGMIAIARAGAGVNNIPIEACAKQGIVVFNTPGANKNGVKELVLAGLLLASRDIVGGIQWCREHAEDPEISAKAEKSKKAFAGNEIQGKKLGVIGLGAIGCEVANAASALGMEVYGYDPFISVNAAWMLSRSVRHIMDAETIYKECDYITIHVPLMDSTKHMICKETLDSMKEGAVVLNFARDLLVNDEDMEAALESGHIKRYITDFPNSRTMAMKGAVVLPHLGASTQEAEENCAVMAVEQLKDYLENGNIKNSVNYPSCDMGVCQSASRLCLLHANIPNMIGQITAILASKGMNIAHMTNKSRGGYAYTMLDLESTPDEEICMQLEKIRDMYRVRII